MGQKFMNPGRIFVRASRRAKAHHRKAVLPRLRRLMKINARLEDNWWKPTHIDLSRKISKELERVKSIYTGKVVRGWDQRRLRGLRIGPTKLGKG